MDYIIDAEIESLLPPATEEELAKLEAQILDGKHVDAGVVAVVGKKRILADGHTRRKICLAHDLPFPTRDKDFDNRETLIEWVINTQLGRRNLTDERKAYYRGKKYLSEKKSVGKPAANYATVAELDIDKNNATAEKVAKQHGVSERTIHNDAKFTEAVDKLPPKVKEAVLAGKVPETKKEIIAGAVPVLCNRCQRVGVTANCSMCKELREPKTKTTPKPKPESDESPVDAFQNPLPKNCRKAYQDPWIQNSIDFLAVTEEKLRMEQIVNGMHKRKAAYPFINPTDVIDGIGFAMNYLESVLNHLKKFRPAGVCPKCDGKGCATCKMCGMVTREMYEEMKK